MKFRTCFSIVFSVVLSISTSTWSSADSIENFDYADGTLDTLNGGSGWGSAWRNNFSRNGGDWSVASSVAVSAADGSRHIRDLDQNYSTGIVYADFVFQSTNTDDNPYSAFEFFSGGDSDGSNRVFALGLMRNDDGNPVGSESDFFVRTQDGAGGATLGLAEIADYDTNLNRFVSRIDLDANTLDVFFNPTASTDLILGTGDASVALAASVSFDRAVIANFGDQSSPSGASFDNVYIGTTAPVITPVPEPSSMLAIALGFGACVVSRRKK